MTFEMFSFLFRTIDWKAKKGKDKEPAEESKQYLEESLLETTTPETKLRQLVELPAGIDYNEWLASHTIALFDHINLIYGTISEFCTPLICPEMTGPGNVSMFLSLTSLKDIKVPANTHIEYVTIFIQKTINDESIFPTKYDQKFPPDFEATVKRILQLLYQVLAHIYHAHFREIVLLNLHPHLNCLFSHLVLLGDNFKLLDEKDLSPLEDLAVALGLIAPTPPPQSLTPTPPKNAIADSEKDSEQQQQQQSQQQLPQQQQQQPLEQGTSSK